MEKLIAARKHTSDYDEVFLKRYQQIYKWGMQITRHNRELSEDLVHEVYMQFTSVATDFSKVECFDNYLYVTLRNAYYSYLRRTAKQREHITSVELDIVEDHEHTSPLERIEVSERLFAICQYACSRKKNSVSACILLFRFFHGYFPSEIALILNSSRNLVDVALLTARREAVAYLTGQNLSNKLIRNFNVDQLPREYLHGSKDITKFFRQMIFAAHEGDCLEPETIRDIYQPGKSVVIRNVLSHIVSCPNCLNEVNCLLGLPLLTERHPLDTLGREDIRRKKQLSKVAGIR